MEDCWLLLLLLLFQQHFLFANPRLVHHHVVGPHSTEILLYSTTTHAQTAHLLSRTATTSTTSTAHR